jgi:uncharacterized phage protein (TIGR01671 family)
MRQIEFRGKLKTTIEGKNEWVFGYVSIRYGSYHIGFENKLVGQYQDLQVIPETIGQFTGLLDKNGTKIYEGDIIKYDDSEDMSRWVSGEKAIIISYTYKMVARMKPYDEYIGCNQNILNEEFKDCVEVIGNIHQNKELVKEQQ